MRTFIDPSGTAWNVFEVRRASHRPESVRPGLEDGWLTFQCAAEKRRVGHYPSNWESMSDGELLLLCRRGLAVTLGRTALDQLGGALASPSGLAEPSLQLERSVQSPRDPA